MATADNKESKHYFHMPKLRQSNIDNGSQNQGCAFPHRTTLQTDT